MAGPSLEGTGVNGVRRQQYPRRGMERKPQPDHERVGVFFSFFASSLPLELVQQVMAPCHGGLGGSCFLAFVLLL